ncbi:hypothetical protein [Pseudomonas citronellolis]|uniref:hypothetical protein n=1 Tax=Pseudomonas citronellolis TaxID=53408 RepID=UPI0020A021DE|nr:hypothetical protein [Pseudomonas citronellolis]MCP1603531.1 pyruvate/2-oxoglutarate dehydrogenase complex dihydrolipoamide acyltransferase (E2) component [Pseudomonas citronellolis]MCP1653402.1 pyruvate/2-oxoglutarate dehydrogenase complex dihydrolipoamide acyltransferase (E2) component [Pseudomonas citronellolis]MCP1720278.1 pyruvate/2-oxoglutarate dehydrogenase complex dihydrolipoamide acyltransferase (E2) component [Pseudomonas citronellolis]MDN6873198.1 hypothetical protein [Pseudomonas
MLRRFVLLTLLPLLLSACGDADKAPPAKAEAPAVAPEPAAPPRPAPAASAKPAAPKAELGKPLAPERLPVADAKPKKAAEPSVNKPLPPSKLDLRLPRDVLHGLEPGRALREDLDKPLLPPMFEEKESPFQVGGRLIQRERGERSDPSDDSWHSEIRGAEVQFQFRN